MNDCKHCGEWVLKMAELTTELIEKDAEILQLRKELNEAILKGME